MNENPGAKVFLFLGLFVLASAGTGCMKKDRAASGEPAPAAVAASTPGQSPAADGRPAGRHALLEIHAQLEVDVQDVAHTKAIAARLADYTKSHSGYVADSRDDGVTTHMVLRLPPADLRGARAELRGDGSIVRESEQAIDVTDAISDVDARLRSARVEETRILKLLEEKSGSITDVLAAERALADVRQRVERLEADQRLAQGVSIWRRST